MARTFAVDEGQGRNLYEAAADAAAQGAAVTVCAWVRPTSTSLSGNRMVIGRDEDSDGDRVFQFRLSAGKIQFIPFNASTNGSAIATTVLTADVWAFVAATYDGSLGSDNIKVFRDSGTAEATGALAGDLCTDTTGVTIGHRSRKNDGSSFGTEKFDGDIAECAEWTRALSSGEIDALAKGFSPLCFLNGLNWYAPLWGNSDPEVDRVGGMALDVLGATAPAKADHPPMIYPSGLLVPGVGSAGGPGGTVIPIFDHYYRMMRTA